MESNFMQVVEPCKNCGSTERHTQRFSATSGGRIVVFCSKCLLELESTTVTVTSAPSITNYTTFVMPKKK